MRLYLFSFLTWPIGYIIKIILSYDLSVEEIGVLYWILSLITLLVAYHDLWLTESLNFFLPKAIIEKDYNKFKSIVTYAFLAQIPTSLLIWWVLFFGSDYLAVHYFHNNYKLATQTAEVFKVFSIFFVLLNIYTIINTIYWATQNTKYQKWVEFFRMIWIFSFTVMFWVLDMWSLVEYAWTRNLWLIFGIILSYILFYFKYYKIYLSNAKIYFDKNLFKEIFKYALWVLLAANVWTVLWQIDMQLIIYYLGSESAWYYTNYLSIIWMPFLIITPIIGFLFPVVSELNSRKDFSKIATIKTMFYKYFASIWVIVGSFMFIFSKEIAIVLFGQKFEYSWTVLAYSVFFLIFNFLLQINFQILAWIWKIQDRVKTLSVWLVINLTLNILLIPKLGASWSSLAVWLSWIPIFYLSHYFTRDYFNWFDWKFFFKNIIATFVLSTVIYFISRGFLVDKTKIQMLILILIMWVLYIIPIILLNLKEWKLFFGELKRIRLSKKTNLNIETIEI